MHLGELLHPGCPACRLRIMAKPWPSYSCPGKPSFNGSKNGWQNATMIGPRRVVRVECQCMGGLDASAGGEAGRGSAAARADCGTNISGAGGR